VDHFGASRADSIGVAGIHVREICERPKLAEAICRQRYSAPRGVHVAGAGIDRPGYVESGALELSSRVDAAQRVAAAGARERERIGQDLHDGAQQRLTALRIRLAVAAREFESRGDPDASLRFSDFVEDVVGPDGR
jgi:signal transduction histidine kinase